jgi:homoserine dehydrogenase
MASSLHLSQIKAAPDRECRLALLGFGTVGSAVARLLSYHSENYRLRLTHVCNRNVEKKRVNWVSEDVTWTDSVDEVLSSDADVIVELVGGIEPAYDWVRRALESGKSVVTANKQLMAHHGTELLQLARRCGQQLAFGASVAGGVPVLSGLLEGLGGDRLHRIAGILNGTCNYILTRIETAGVSFEEALREAQEAGYAEADPTDDLDGYDARAKLVILALTGLRADVRPEEVECGSIRNVSRVDFEYARELGCTIRQVSQAELCGDVLLASVQPALVPLGSPLAGVSGSQNLVVSTGKFGGETVFSGYGAGGNPTAVAVVSDLLQILRREVKKSPDADAFSAKRVAASADFESKHYLRFMVKDRPGVLAALAGVFASHQINIDSVLQRPGYAKTDLPFVITLESCHNSHVQHALAEINAFDFQVQNAFNMPILG